jgi:hypothetical protein
MVLSVGALGGVLALLGAVLLWRHRERSQARRNPLTSHLLRSPGQSVRDQFEQLRWDVALYLSLGMLPIPLVIGVLLAEWALRGEAPGTVQVAFLSMAAVCGLAWLGWKLWASMRNLRQLWLGCEAEVAVGQELNELLRHGFRVFHDFPVGQREFNVDHVLVGPTGVFAIETTGRSMPKPGAAGWEVTYDGKALQFPGWREADPIRQAETAGAWLQVWLSNAVGERVKVQPVVVLPGWQVKRTGAEEIPVLASEQIPSYFTSAYRVLDAKLVQQIALQLEQRCRDVTPAPYRAGLEKH